MLAVLLMAVPSALADDPFNSSRAADLFPESSGKAGFNSGRANNFNDYRTSLNAEYARQIKEYEWRRSQLQKGRTAPDRDIKPVAPRPWSEKDSHRDRQISIKEVVKPIKGNGAPKPIAPVVIQEGDNSAPSLAVSYFGTAARLRSPAAKFRVAGVSESAVADAWTRLSKPDYAPLVADCAKYKQMLGLCDWGYMTFLEKVALAAAADKSSAATLMAYLAAQAGYTVRLARTRENTLDMVFASEHIIFDRPYMREGDDVFYAYFTKSASYEICQSRFSSEKGLSLWLTSLPKLDEHLSPSRTIKSQRYGDFQVTSSVNRNLIDFYATYPTSKVGSNFVSRWAMYANTPASGNMRSNVYPQIRNLVAGKSQLEAVERILNWIQTGLVYEYDDKVWGGDRAFFPEESLFYPYCDCEDRSILFTRIVRDLLGLKCLLVYYPGHLAAAVAFPQGVSGDYIMYDGQRFTIADPTFIGAKVGYTMTNMDNAAATVILLD